MAQLGTVALFLLVGMGFALYVGSNGQYGQQFYAYYSTITKFDINGMFNLILNALTQNGLGGILNIGTIMVSGILSLALSQSIRYAVGIALITGVATLLFSPMTFLNELALPWQVSLLAGGFFNLLILVAMLQFIAEKEW